MKKEDCEFKIKICEQSPVVAGLQVKNIHFREDARVKVWERDDIGLVDINGSIEFTYEYRSDGSFCVWHRRTRISELMTHDDLAKLISMQVN